jgi:hypothetical protein
MKPTLRLHRLFASLVVPSVVVLAVTGPAAADPPSDPTAGLSLHEREVWAERKTNIEKVAAGATTACGTPITASFDIPSFKGQDVDKSLPTAACRDSVLALKTFCSDDVGKAAVQRSVSKVTCRSSSTGTKPVLGSNKELVVNIDTSSTSIQLEGKGKDWSWQGALAELVHAPNPEAGQPDMPLRERRHWDEIVAQRNKDAASTSSNCGTTISVKVDIASFKGLDIEKNPPGGKCRDAILALGSMCAFSPVAKKTVQNKVTNIVCKSSTDGTKPTLADHTLTVHIDPNKSVNGSWKGVLENTL